MGPASLLIPIVFWLGLAPWFGAAVFVAVAAPIVFRIVRHEDPTLPKVLSVNLDGQHSTLLGGEIVSGLLGALVKLELVCAALVAVALIGDWAIYLRSGGGLGDAIVLPFLRTALFLTAAGLLAYDWLVVRPRTEAARREYVDNADTPDIANGALDRFEHYGRESVLILTGLIFALLGLLLFGAAGLGTGAGRTFTFG